MIGDSFSFTIEGVDVEAVQSKHWQYVDPILNIDPKSIRFCADGFMIPDLAWQRARIAILHQLNLRNPRWLERRARMARKKRRGWA